MDSVNIFITFKSSAFAMLIPIGCKYLDLVDMISVETKIHYRICSLKMEDEVDGNLFLIRITNDSSILFNIKLKMKDPRLNLKKCWTIILLNVTFIWTAHIHQLMMNWNIHECLTFWGSRLSQSQRYMTLPRACKYRSR